MFAVKKKHSSAVTRKASCPNTLPVGPVRHFQRQDINNILHNPPTSRSQVESEPYRNDQLGFGTVKVSLRFASPKEVRELYWRYGVRIPGTPPELNFGADGAIPQQYRKSLQLAFDMIYRIEKSILFATELNRLKQKSSKAPQISTLNVSKMQQALTRMRIHLADTTVREKEVQKAVQEEQAADSGLVLEQQTAGFTKMGSNEVYLREFALQQGVESMASLLFHESIHVAGVPMGPLMLYEPHLHEFEARVGFPIMMGGADISPIPVQRMGFGSLSIGYVLRTIGGEEMPSDLHIEILDDEHQSILKKPIASSPGNHIYVWDGKDSRNQPVPRGLYTVRITSQDMSLLGSALIEVRR